MFPERLRVDRLASPLDGVNAPGARSGFRYESCRPTPSISLRHVRLWSISGENSVPAPANAAYYATTVSARSEPVSENRWRLSKRWANFTDRGSIVRFGGMSVYSSPATLAAPRTADRAWLIAGLVSP